MRNLNQVKGKDGTPGVQGPISRNKKKALGRVLGGKSGSDPGREKNPPER